MSGSLLDDEEEITGINVTPLVDVMLVLLIIFMVTASYIVQRTIEVKLPSAETAEELKNKSLDFVLNAKSQLFLNGQKIAFVDVGTHISQEKEKLAVGAKDLQALITADEKTPHGKVVKLIDTVRKNGITEFAINVDAVAPEKPHPDGSSSSPNP